jgi:hypothetical protein
MVKFNAKKKINFHHNLDENLPNHKYHFATTHYDLNHSFRAFIRDFCLFLRFFGRFWLISYSSSRKNVNFRSNSNIYSNNAKIITYLNKIIPYPNERTPIVGTLVVIIVASSTFVRSFVRA